jgi:hypothetical protein
MICTIDDTSCAPVTVSDELRAEIVRAAAAALLRIGKTYQKHCLLQQAISPYLKIIAYYPRSEAASIAVDELLCIARTMEAHCQLHIAMGVYDRLERAARFRRWEGHSIDAEDAIL